MPTIVSKAIRVVDFEGQTIDEYVGNVAATKDDSISIAHVQCHESGSSEPWLTLDYEEYICILKGCIEFHYHQENNNKNNNNDDALVLYAKEGDTVYIQKGERFRLVFPKGNVEYIPVCRPAFRPDRCHREEGDTESSVTIRLKELHGTHNSEPIKTTTTNTSSNNNNKDNAPNANANAPANDDDESSERLYHMCQKTLWNNAVQKGIAYFPPTFEMDGNFIHATAIPNRLLQTANHFYTNVRGDWICIELSKSTLFNVCGIVTIFEKAKPVGKTEALQSGKNEKKEEEKEWLFPHIFGGIPTSVNGVVMRTFDMERLEDGTFVRIVGLTT